MKKALSIFGVVLGVLIIVVVLAANKYRTPGTSLGAQLFQLAAPTSLFQSSLQSDLIAQPVSLDTSSFTNLQDIAPAQKTFTDPRGSNIKCYTPWVQTASGSWICLDIAAASVTSTNTQIAPSQQLSICPQGNTYCKDQAGECRPCKYVDDGVAINPSIAPIQTAGYGGTCSGKPGYCLGKTTSGGDVCIPCQYTSVTSTNTQIAPAQKTFTDPRGSNIKCYTPWVQTASGSWICLDIAAAASVTSTNTQIVPGQYTNICPQGSTYCKDQQGECRPCKYVDDVVTTLRLGDKSVAVTAMQRALAARGYYSGNFDGSFGPGTFAAVREYQRNSGLVADGAAGVNTLTSLGLAGSSSSSTASTTSAAASRNSNTQFTIGFGGKINTILPIVHTGKTYEWCKANSDWNTPGHGFVWGSVNGYCEIYGVGGGSNTQNNTY